MKEGDQERAKRKAAIERLPRELRPFFQDQEEEDDPELLGREAAFVRLDRKIRLYLVNGMYTQALDALDGDPGYVRYHEEDERFRKLREHILEEGRSQQGSCD